MRTFKPHRTREIDKPLSADSKHGILLFGGLIDAFVVNMKTKVNSHNEFDHDNI
jgi:hypothetical protein